MHVTYINEIDNSVSNFEKLWMDILQHEQCWLTMQTIFLKDSKLQNPLPCYMCKKDIANIHNWQWNMPVISIKGHTCDLLCSCVSKYKSKTSNYSFYLIAAVYSIISILSIVIIIFLSFYSFSLSNLPPIKSIPLTFRYFNNDSDVSTFPSKTNINPE